MPNCTGCIHLKPFDYVDNFCDYIGDTGHPRGCEVENCLHKTLLKPVKKKSKPYKKGHFTGQTEEIKEYLKRSKKTNVICI